MQKHGCHVLRGNGGLRCNVCQGAEKVRVVDSLPGGTVEASSSDQKYRLSGTGGDDGLVGQMGFEGKPPGTISFYQDIVRQLRKISDRNQGGGEFVMFGRGPHAEAAMTAQGRGQGLASGDGGEEGDMGGRTDMGGGGAEDCAKELEFIGKEIKGGRFAARAGDGCNAGPDRE